MHARRFGPELGELVEEAAIEIETFQLRHIVELFVPFVQVENGEGCIRTNIGNDGFSIRVIFTRIEFALIAEGESSFEAALGAQLWCRHLSFRVIRLIALINFEGSLAGEAGGGEEHGVDYKLFSGMHEMPVSLELRKKW